MKTIKRRLKKEMKSALTNACKTLKLEVHRSVINRIPKKFLFLTKEYLYDGERFCAVGYLAARAGISSSTLEKIDQELVFDDNCEGDKTLTQKIAEKLAQTYHTSIPVLHDLIDFNDHENTEKVSRILRRFGVIDKDTIVTWEDEETAQAREEKELSDV